ncbi:hypothetical protein [Schumannella luteola]
MSRTRHLTGATLIIIATAIGGGAGYLLTVFAGIRLGHDYAGFAVFWSALYLIVGALSGVQHEVSRASHPRTEGQAAHSRPIVRNFALGTAVAVAVLVTASSPLWMPALADSGGYALLLPLLVGVTWYVAVAVLGGVFYGLSFWPLIAGMIAFDGVLRLVVVGALLLVTSDVAILAWAVVLPFVVAPVVFWLIARRRVVGQFVLDVGYRRLAWNVARTIAGAAASGVLISGLPLFVGVAASGQPAAYTSALLFAISATRAPIVIVVLSLQSYLVVRFQAAREHLARWVLLVVGAILVGSALLALAAWAWGPWALSLVGRGFELPGALIAAIVFSGGLVGALCVTGAAALSLARHFVSTLGWISAAVVVVVVLLLPLPIETALVAATFGGPIVGLVVHAVGLALTRGRA